jgi:serine/threonine-protein kinase
MGPQAPIGPYRIDRRLATGGMAEVFVARREGPHGFTKRVALKRILPQYAGDPDFVAMFIDEAKVAARLEHPNVVQVFDFGEHSGSLFLAMELVEGTNVNRLLRAAGARDEIIPLDTALYITAQVAQALAYAHRLQDDEGKPIGFVHRDVSPANVLLTSTGHVKLSDFGIAKVAAQSRHTEDGHVRGKLGYMSPEQVLGKNIDGRSDVFTLATVLAEMLIGSSLFGSGSELDVLIRIRDVDLAVLERSERRIPKDVSKVLGRALSRDREHRPSASAFADALEEIRRRRGMGHGAERLARLLERMSLVERDYGRPEDVPGRMTALLDTSSLSTDAENLVQGIGPTSPEIYRVRLEDGSEVGPISFPRLVQLVTSGKVRRDTVIAKEGQSFAPATELPELTRFITSPALTWHLDDILRADRRGELGAARLVPIVYQIMRDRETGVLHLWDQKRRKKIYFVDGRPEFVASTDRSELLGEYLVAHGHCLRMEVEMALALLPRYGGRLGDALVGLGVLRPVELFRAITEQVRSRLIEAFRWRAGRWAFARDARSHEETFPIGESGFQVLRDAVRTASLSELEAGLSPYWEDPLTFPERPPVRLAEFHLPHEWGRMIAELDVPTTVGAFLADVASRSADELEQAYRVIFLALSCELLVDARR